MRSVKNIVTLFDLKRQRNNNGINVNSVKNSNNYGYSNRRINNNNNRNNNRNKLTKRLINICNKILVSREDDCNCVDLDNNPSSKISQCKKTNKKPRCNQYNTCKDYFTKFMSGSEPKYNPPHWKQKPIKGSHNCYAYFLDDHIEKVKQKCYDICESNGYPRDICETSNNAVSGCSNLKPQPGDYAAEHGIDGFKKNRTYTCDAMETKIFKDNWNANHPTGTPQSNIYKVNFEKACKPRYYKGAMVIQEGKTYHFYRQDDNVRFSHKQGTLEVENKDASGNPIYVPHLADIDYNKSKSRNGITYDNFCGYYCIPKNDYISTHAAGGGRSKKKKRR